MEWIDVNKELPISPSKVIVKTRTQYTDGNILRIDFHLDKENKPVWACKNQIVEKWLKDGK